MHSRMNVVSVVKAAPVSVVATVVLSTANAVKAQVLRVVLSVSVAKAATPAASAVAVTSTVTASRLRVVMTQRQRLHVAVSVMHNR